MTIIRPTITVTATAYETADTIGGKITLSNVMDVTGGSAILDSITLTDAANQKPVGKFYIFDSDPSSSTFTDELAGVIHANDLAKLLHVVDVASGDWHTTDSKGFAVKQNLNLACKAVGTKNLYAVYITTGTPTFAATTNFAATFAFRRGLITK